MKKPVLDGRTGDDLYRQLSALARTYTPEWRLEDTKDDPGAAIAALFCRMLQQSIDRLNALPDRWYIAFLNGIGFHLPPPTPAAGLMYFAPYDMVTQPVTVPAGTQVFTPDADGENIVYETTRTIQATSAKLTDIYYADSALDRIERLDLTRPQTFFASCSQNLQRHRFWFSQPDVLRLDGPASIEVELRQAVRGYEIQTAERLAQMKWTYEVDGQEKTFEQVRAQQGRIVLEKQNDCPMQPDEQGNLYIYCTGTPEQELVLEQILVRSAPLVPYAADSLFAGDLPLDDGGYCFGRRPAPYALFYLRSDTILCKHGATVHLCLHLKACVDEPPEQQPQYDFTQNLIDKTQAVVRKPDEACITAVVWEYFNGLGWQTLAVTGNRNPFSGKQDGTVELRFVVPADLAEIPVNAQMGRYIRARVVEVQNLFSTYARWYVPYVCNAFFQWSYEQAVPVCACGAQNNGNCTELHEAQAMTQMHLPALIPMQPAPCAMYIRFDRSPHAMPLSLWFEVVGRVPMSETLVWEQATVEGFAPVACVDMTDNLHHTGHVLLYLSEPLAEVTIFGQIGYWLRVSRGNQAARAVPYIVSARLNTIDAQQVERQPDQYFDVGVYEAGKTVQLSSVPVISCTVWVDESGVLSQTDAQALAERNPDSTELVWEDGVLTHCWVRWQPIEALSLEKPDANVFVLDPYTGTVTFGDGRHGRVPPSGDRVIRIASVSGGGTRGNVPVGQVHALVGALPRVETVQNIGEMSGGTDRFSRSRIERVANKRLRHRGRAAGTMDFEELVLEAFAQVKQVRCFSQRDENGQFAPGHVTVVLMGSQSGQTSDALCDAVYEFLAERCSCCLVAEGRLHVCPATLLTVRAQITIGLQRPEDAADVQGQVMARVTKLIDQTWRARQIGEQIRPDEVWSVVRDTPGVRMIERILLEGVYDAEGQQHMTALDNGNDFLYAVVQSGIHQVQIRT